ncbi:MAG TPA: Imm27 family immunity protein [Bacteroidia bacterium]|nr:Imm27 family immunity protein [Bacteroidia bacterium]
MYKDFILKKVLPYKNLGHKILSDGTELFGNDKQIAPQAWLHQIYPPLADVDIEDIEKMIGNKLPNSIKNFYKEMNGFSVFIGKLTVDGLRKNFSRNIEASWQPFSIETINKKERPKNAKDEFIFIGSYSETGNIIYIDTKNENISICKVNNANPIITYENLFNFLLEEISDIFTKNNLKYTIIESGPEIELKLKRLKEIKIDATNWVCYYIDELNGEKWIKEYPNSDYHGGGAPILTKIEKFPWE